MFRYPIFKTTMLVTSASGAYVISSHRSGNLGTAPFRSINYIQEKMDAFPGIRKYKNNAAYIETTPKLAVSTINSRDGAVSEVFKTFKADDDPMHTVSFVYCGPISIGFPHMVHGGVIATLLRQTAQHTFGGDDRGHLNVNYLKPTKIDQILRIETEPRQDGLALQLYSENNERLVSAEYLLETPEINNK